MFNLYLKRLLLSIIPISFFLFCLLPFQIVKANKLDYRYTKHFDIQKLSIEEGLSQSVVNKIVQDSNGFIWLATEDGLNRFDGYDFLIYQHDHKKPLSLHENWVVSLAVEEDKGLWVGTIAGLSYMDFATQKFTDFGAIFPELDSIITDIIYLKGLGVWIATSKGLFFRSTKADVNGDIDSDYDPTNDTDRKKIFSSSFEQISLSDNGELQPHIKSISYSVNSIYIGTSRCLFKISITTKLVTNLCDTKQLSVMKKKEINKLLFDNGSLWIGTGSGLFQYNVKTTKLRAFYENSVEGQSIASDYVQDLVIDSANSLWVSTINGISIFNKKTHRFISHTQIGLGKNQLSSPDILSSFIDNEGLVWLGTYGRGVNLLNPNQQRFEHLLTQKDALDIDSTNTVHGIEKDQYENLWLASYGGGLIKYNLMTGKISRPLNEQKIKHDEYVFSLEIDKLERLWVTTFSEILLLDIKTNKIIDHDIFVDGVAMGNSIKVSELFEDHLGAIWILGERGLYKQILSDAITENSPLVKERIDFENWTEKLPYSYRVKSTALLAMAEDVYGNLWIGGDAGLLFFNQKEDKWQHYTYDATIPNSLSSDSVQSIYIDNQNLVWVGTADGLNRVKKTNSSEGERYYFERITTHEGLPSNSVYGIQQDEQSNIWLSTSRGLVKYNKNILKMDLFRSSDGLSSDEFNLGGAFTDEDNRAYFTSINGVTSIIDSNISKLVKKSDIKFVKVKLGSEVLDPFKILLNNKIETKNIEYGTAIEIWVSAMNYFKFGVSRYRYRINGLDDKWINLGGNRKLFIAGLAEGNYSIEIQSRTTGEPWSSNAIKLFVKVYSDFYKSRQFIFLAILVVAVAFLIALIVISRKFNLRLTSEIKKQSLEKLRVKELRVDNDSLIFSVSDRDRTIARLSGELKITNSKVDIERYRDIVTGFYRFNFILDINDKLTDKQSSRNLKRSKDLQELQASPLRNYGLAAIIEFVNYSDIGKNHGSLEAVDFLSQVSIDLRRGTNADTQFYTLNDGKYILFNASENKQRIVDGLSNLCKSFNNTSYEIANGRTVRCDSKLTFVDLENLQINNKSELVKAKRLLQLAHDKNEHSLREQNENASKELKILRPLSCESLTDDFDFDVLVEDGTLSIVYFYPVRS